MDDNRKLTATILGTNAGLAILVRLLLAGRDDLGDLAREADRLLLAHADKMTQPPRDFELLIDEKAQKTVAALIADAKDLRGDKPR